MRRLRWISLVFSLGQLAAIAQEQTAPSAELVQYIRESKKAGLSTDQITKNAVVAGWAKPVVEQAVEMEKNGRPAPGPVKLEKAKPEAPKTAAITPAVTVQPPGSNPEAASAADASARSTELGGMPAVGVDRTISDTYQIGEGDVLQVSVWGEPAASVPSGVVRPDGMISMPLIKDIRVAGLTPAEAEKSITEQLLKQIKSADVTVIVSQINSKKVFVVGGGVKKEGPISFTYRMTVMQAISEAGGLTDYAKRKKIYVLRNENGRQYKLPFDYDAVLRGERTELNIPLQAGDTLVVPNH